MKVVDGNGTVTTYEYSDRDLLTMEISEVTGVTTYAYDERGQVIRETDARDVTVKRQYDALGRLRFVDYPEYDLDIMYDWDDKSVPFSKGRITAIRRGGESVDYRYDRFGRVIQDGALTYGYDKNGNRTTIGYPGGVTATYTYDYANRQATLASQDGEQPTQPLVTSASYKPFGPLTALALGNGLTEIRTYTKRYFPLSIEVPDRLSWTYDTDAMGNVAAIVDNLDPNGGRIYSYQEHQYYLTVGVGPWGAQGWAYDKSGNRLLGTLDDISTDYLYRPNAAGANSPQLARISVEGQPRPARYYYDAAGNQIYEAKDDSKVKYSYNGSGLLSSIRSESANEPQSLTSLQYDGRDFLSRSVLELDPGLSLERWETRPTYSSEGMLYHRHSEHHPAPRSPRDAYSTTRAESLFYFAGRLIAQLEKNLTARPGESLKEVNKLEFLNVDHLGTPLQITDDGGNVVWQGGFTPFGEDFEGAATFLRLPGQWHDETWGQGSLRGGLYYNVHRWYRCLTGCYLTPDPLARLTPEDGAYLYVGANPLASMDPLGLAQIKCESCESLKEKIEDVKKILENLKATGKAAPQGHDTPGSPYVTGAVTGCAWFHPPEGGPPAPYPWTERYRGDFENQPCQFLCTGVHERVHREQCLAKGPDWYRHAPEKETEPPAYRAQLACLQSALASGELDLTTKGVNY